MKLAFVAVTALAIFVGAVLQDEEKKESTKTKSISQVMKKAHSGRNSLLKKVQKGDATDEEKMELLALYIDLVDNEPPQGELGEWQMMAGRATVAAARVVVGQEGAIDVLKEATNCKACHDTFKPE